MTVADRAMQSVQTPPTSNAVPACRLCGSVGLRSFLDLGATPPCEPFLPAEALDRPEVTYPLHLRVCDRCLLGQLPPLIAPEETFTEYAHFSSFSTSWAQHAEKFVSGAVERLGLGSDAFIVEVASNDGYLLQHVVARGVRCLGIEPSVNVGTAAREKGVPTLTAFLTPEAVRDVLAAEEAAGLHTAEGHDGFAEAVSRVREDLVAFLIDARREGRKVVGYGAPGKGCSTTAASGPTCSRTPSTGTPASTVASAREHVFRCRPPSGSPRIARTTWSSCPGICAPSSSSSSPTCVGGAGGRSPHPDARGGLTLVPARLCRFVGCSVAGPCGREISDTIPSARCLRCCRSRCPMSVSDVTDAYDDDNRTTPQQVHPRSSSYC